MTLVAGLVVGCAGDDGTFDVGPADASTPDVQVVLDASDFMPDVDDAGPSYDTGVLDSAGSDAPSPHCPGECRPDEGTCRGLGACVLWSAAPMCMATAGSLAIGIPCEETDQCMVGLACFGGPSGGVCGRVCCPADPTSCDEGDVCSGSGMLVDGTATEFGQCRPSRECNLLSTGVCSEGEGCYVIGVGETECRPAGAMEVGETCEGPADCVPGLTCVGAFDKTCVRNCRVGAADACPPGEGECRAYADSPEGAGLCSGSASARR